MKSFQNQVIKPVWRFLKPWLTAVAIFLILRYTGALAGISALTNRALLETTLLDADPAEYAIKNKEKLDFNFTINTLDGKPVDFNTFKGKPIFLNIWATWCGPCRAEMPSIQKLYETVNNDSVNFIMLSYDTEDQTQKVKNFIKSKGFTFPVYMAGDLPPQLQVQTIPSTFIITSDGTFAFKKTGMADYDTNKFRKFLQKLTEAPPVN